MFSVVFLAAIGDDKLDGYKCTTIYGTGIRKFCFWIYVSFDFLMMIFGFFVCKSRKRSRVTTRVCVFLVSWFLYFILSIVCN